MAAGNWYSSVSVLSFTYKCNLSRKNTIKARKKDGTKGRLHFQRLKNDIHQFKGIKNPFLKGISKNPRIEILWSPNLQKSSRLKKKIHFAPSQVINFLMDF